MVLSILSNFHPLHEPQALLLHPPHHLLLEFDVSTPPLLLYESWEGYSYGYYPDGDVYISRMFEYSFDDYFFHEEDLLSRRCTYIDDECESASVNPHDGRRNNDVHALCPASLRTSSHHDRLGCDGMPRGDGTGGGIERESEKVER